MLYHNRCFKFYEGVDSVHDKIVAECIKKSVYEKGDFKIEPYENWIDIGSNIGCFSFRAKMNGANVLKMIEPGPKNNEIGSIKEISTFQKLLINQWIRLCILFNNSLRKIYVSR